MSNDNEKHPLWDQTVFMAELLGCKFPGSKECDRLARGPDRDRAVNNWNWFYRFELSYREVQAEQKREQKREQIKVVK